MADNILEIKNLKKYFKTNRGLLHAVDDISFTLERGKTLGIVGESGCGKSTTGRCILRLIEPTSGEIIFDGRDINKLSKKELRSSRTDMQIIFQDPFSSLNPRCTVMQTIAEGVRMHQKYKSEIDVQKRVLELMDTVGLAERLYNSYPHELDGGRRQRIGIARALAVEPKLIICDEPVSALDVSIQAQILNLLTDLQEELGLTYIFITHDLSVVNHISDEIMVMYLGQAVEKAPTEELFNNPIHPYTKSLLNAIPIPRVGARKERKLIRGEVSSPIDPADECRFAKRCEYCNSQCTGSCPKLKEVNPGHFVACHLFPQNS
ncbi:MAG: ATP-binding cassette domain-containing protein [Sphaerochaetaceae bacterium]|nr:ATP-binding cassette domain-containing protein [Sphaerochaetaceae bacterium]